MGQIPNSDRRSKGIDDARTVIFQPGGIQENFTYNNLDDLRAFAQSLPGSEITVKFDLTLHGGPFTIPAGVYNLQNVILSGRTMSDGSFPALILEEGVQFESGNALLRLHQIRLRCQNTATPIVTPDGSYRINQDLATIEAEGSTHFADMANGGTFSMSVGRNSGLVNSGGSELVRIPAGAAASIFLEADSYIDGDLIELEDATASLSIFYSLRGRFDSQSLVPDSSLSKQAFEQSGATFPQETYPGKVFHDSDANRTFFRNTDDDDYRQHAVLPAVSFVDATATTGGTPLVHNSLTYQVENLNPVRVSASFSGSLSTANRDFIATLNIQGVYNDVIYRQQPGATPNVLNGSFDYVYTPASTGSQTIELTFQSEGSPADATMYSSLIQVEEVDG